MHLHTKVRIAVTAAASLLLALHLAFPSFRLDAGSLVLIGLAIAPWLALLFKSIEIPGIGRFESQLQDLRAATESATEKAESALIATGGPAGDFSEGESLLRLGDEYDGLRSSLHGSNARTQLLTQIAGRMLALGAVLDSHTLLGALSGPSPGRRLAAYISLFRSPDPGFTGVLLDTVTQRESTAFGQYWGIQALRALVAVFGPGAIPSESRKKLHEFLARVDAGSSRQHELRALLAELDGRVAPFDRHAILATPVA